MESHKYNELRHRLWVLWHNTVDLISKYEEAGFRKNAGLSYQQYLILHTMTNLGNPVTATDMVDKVNRNTNTISTMLDRMEKQGLVRKLRDLSDRRQVRVEITEYGLEKLDQATKVGWRLVERLMSSYSDEDLKVLAQELKKLREKVFQELYPGQVIQDIRAEDFNKITHLFENAQS